MKILFFFLRTSFLLKADQKLFIRLCVLRHHCADFVFIFVCARSLVCLFLHLRTHACFSVSLLALIICRARPWAEVSGDQPTLIQCVCVCVCVCVRAFMHRSPLCCSLAPLLMTQQSTLMTRNTYSLLFCEPQLISWSVKHRKCANPFKNKK